MALLYQLDASVIGTMFSDTGKTTQITDGGNVAAWAAPNGSVTTDALQSTSGNRPTYRANYSSSGYPAVEFDGTSDSLSTAHSAAWNNTIIDVFIVLTSTNAAASTYRGVFTKWTGSWNDGWGLIYNFGNFSFGAPLYTNVIVKSTINSRILVHCHLENGCNGGEIGPVYGGTLSGSGPANNTQSVQIGRADTSANYWFEGAINEIRVFGGGETDSTLVTQKNILRSKWGLASIAGGIPIARGMHGGMR
jgi:hypothetical protein